MKQKKNKTKIYGNAKSALTTKEWEALGILELQFPLTEVQLKTKYKQLVKKYHPDKYVGNPLAELAQEKISEINAAYDEIKSCVKHIIDTNPQVRTNEKLNC